MLLLMIMVVCENTWRTFHLFRCKVCNADGPGMALNSDLTCFFLFCGLPGFRVREDVPNYQDLAFYRAPVGSIVFAASNLCIPVFVTRLTTTPCPNRASEQTKYCHRHMYIFIHMYIY